jgi:hypothetical protein
LPSWSALALVGWGSRGVGDLLAWICTTGGGESLPVGSRGWSGRKDEEGPCMCVGSGLSRADKGGTTRKQWRRARHATSSSVGLTARQASSVDPRWPCLKEAGVPGRHVLAVCGWQTRSSPSLPLVLTSYIMCLAFSAFFFILSCPCNPSPRLARPWLQDERASGSRRRRKV